MHPLRQALLVTRVARDLGVPLKGSAGKATENCAAMLAAAERLIEP